MPSFDRRNRQELDALVEEYTMQRSLSRRSFLQRATVAGLGKLVQLDKFLNMNQYRQDYAQAWIDLGSYQGKLYAIMPKANGKSTVWYSPKQFQAMGATVPQTWDDLIALSNKFASAGKYPWALGVESAASSGWPASDWVSEIYMNKYGLNKYNQWAQHKIP